jgi:FAD binding domain
MAARYLDGVPRNLERVSLRIWSNNAWFAIAGDCIFSFSVTSVAILLIISHTPRLRISINSEGSNEDDLPKQNRCVDRRRRSTGLSLACQLVRYGIDFIIVDKNETVTPYSKALGVQARTL